MTRMLNGDFDSSIGSRLQIWHAAVEAISQNPLTGVGPTGPSDALRELSNKGELTPVALQAGLSQIHNEILANTLRLGVFGLLSILAIYLVPISLLMKKISSVDEIGQRAGVMGVLFVTGYFIFGLTFEIFNIKMFATFYAVTVATVLAIVDQQAAASSFRRDGDRADRRGEKAI
jgi:O-antigen ligase